MRETMIKMLECLVREDETITLMEFIEGLEEFLLSIDDETQICK